MLKRILLGSFFLGVGFVMIYFSDNLMKTMGRWQWAEEYLGGTRQGYSIVGFGIMVFGFLVLFGVLG